MGIDRGRVGGGKGVSDVGKGTSSILTLLLEAEDGGEATGLAVLTGVLGALDAAVDGTNTGAAVVLTSSTPLVVVTELKPGGGESDLAGADRTVRGFVYITTITISYVSRNSVYEYQQTYCIAGIALTFVR